MGKRVEVAMISARAGHRYLIKGEGELIPLDDVDIDDFDRGQTAIFHAKHYSQDAKANWFTVNLWTGLYITGGSSRKQCLEDFNKALPQYVSMLNNPERYKFFRDNHEELKKLKTQAISQQALHI